MLANAPTSALLLGEAPNSPRPRMIQIAIVEDDATVTASILAFLELTDDIRCVGTFGRAEDYIRMLPSLNVEVVVMDINLPGMSGIQCVQEMKPKRPKVQYLMCTSHNEAEKTFDSLCAGATGYVLKTTPPDQLFQAIRDVKAGGSPMSPEIARLVVSSFMDRNKNVNLLETLSTREQEILHALAKGYSYKEIASQLYLSIETVRTYLRRIYEKLQVHSKVEALNKVFPKEFKGVE